MLTYQSETYEQVENDIKPLLDLHYQELCLHKEVVQLAPIWEKYKILWDQHKLLIFTVRDDGELIGYSVFFTDAHIHYGGLLIAINDVIFVHADYRSTTRAGLKLIDFCDAEMEMLGVDKVIYHVKFKKDWSAVLLRKRYEKEDIVLGKMLKRG